MMVLREVLTTKLVGDAREVKYALHELKLEINRVIEAFEDGQYHVGATMYNSLLYNTQQGNEKAAKLALKVTNQAVKYYHGQLGKQNETLADTVEANKPR